MVWFIVCKNLMLQFPSYKYHNFIEFYKQNQGFNRFIAFIFNLLMWQILCIFFSFCSLDFSVKKRTKEKKMLNIHVLINLVHKKNNDNSTVSSQYKYLDFFSSSNLLPGGLETE